MRLLVTVFFIVVSVLSANAETGKFIAVPRDWVDSKYIAGMKYGTERGVKTGQTLMYQKIYRIAEKNGRVTLTTNGREPILLLRVRAMSEVCQNCHPPLVVYKLIKTKGIPSVKDARKE